MTIKIIEKTLFEKTRTHGARDKQKRKSHFKIGQIVYGESGSRAKILKIKGNKITLQDPDGIKGRFLARLMNNGIEIIG
jgi:hypothetical protein